MVYATKSFWKKSWPLFIAILTTLALAIVLQKKLLYGYFCLEILALFLGYIRFQKKTNALNQALDSWKIPAGKSKMATYDDQAQEMVFEIDNKDVKEGDLLVLEKDDIVPADVKVLSGSGQIQESILVSHKTAVDKTQGDFIIGGSQVVSGKMKVYAVATGESVVVENVKKRILSQSGVTDSTFKSMKRYQVVLSLVLCLMGLTLLYFYFWPINLDDVDNPHMLSLSKAMSFFVLASIVFFLFSLDDNLRIASLIGLQRKVIFKDDSVWALMEKRNLILMKKNGVVIEDKTMPQSVETRLDLAEFKSIVYSLCRYNNSYFSQAVKQNWQSKSILNWRSTEDRKEDGVFGIDADGNSWQLIYDKKAIVSEKRIYLLKNKEIQGSFQVLENLRANAAEAVQQLVKLGFNTQMTCIENPRYAEKLNAIPHFDAIVNAPDVAQLKSMVKDLTSNNAAILVYGDDLLSIPENTVSINFMYANSLADQSDDILILEKELLHIPYAIALGKSLYKQVKVGFWRSFSFSIVAAIFILALDYAFLPVFLALFLLVSVPNFGEHRFDSYRLNG